MFTAKDSQTSRQLSARKLPDFDRMAHVRLEQNYGLPYLRGIEFFKLQPPHWNIPSPTDNLGLGNSKNCLPRGLGITDVAVDPSQATREKRFLIFDRTENHTTYFFSPSFCCPQNLVIAPEDEKAAAAGSDEPLNPLFKEKWDENDLNDGDDEKLEESEEINALLYSDSDYDDDDDEVTSTARIPPKIEEVHDKGNLYEVASCDGSPKRLRLLDGGHKIGRLVKFKSRVRGTISLCNLENDIDLSKREKKVKIRKTLKILENLVPGLKTNEDPVIIIEKAILYLESMKMEAKAVGLA